MCNNRFLFTSLNKPSLIINSTECYCSQASNTSSFMHGWLCDHPKCLPNPSCTYFFQQLACLQVVNSQESIRRTREQGRISRTGARKRTHAAGDLLEVPANSAPSAQVKSGHLALAVADIHEFVAAFAQGQARQRILTPVAIKHGSALGQAWIVHAQLGMTCKSVEACATHCSMEQRIKSKTGCSQSLSYLVSMSSLLM